MVSKAEITWCVKESLSGVQGGRIKFPGLNGKIARVTMSGTYELICHICMNKKRTRSAYFRNVDMQNLKPMFLRDMRCKICK